MNRIRLTLSKHREQKADHGHTRASVGARATLENAQGADPYR
jgi:hypothetical protein